MAARFRGVSAPPVSQQPTSMLPVVFGGQAGAQHDESVPVAYSIPSHLVVPLGVCFLTCACVDRLLIYGNVILSGAGSRRRRAMLEPVPLPNQRQALFPPVIYHDRCQGPAEIGGGRRPTEGINALLLLLAKYIFPSSAAVASALEMTTATKCALVVLGGGQLPETRKKGTQQMFHTSLSLLPLRLSLLVLACFHRPRTTCYGACPLLRHRCVRAEIPAPRPPSFPETCGSACRRRRRRPPPRNRAGTPQEAPELQLLHVGRWHVADYSLVALFSPHSA